MTAWGYYSHFSPRFHAPRHFFIWDRKAGLHCPPKMVRSEHPTSDSRRRLSYINGVSQPELGNEENILPKTENPKPKTALN
jgi:hypothetical protein